MKIIHTADLHLDSKLESNLDPSMARERRGELLDTFSRMVSYASDNGVSVIIIAGDLFDKLHVRKSAKKRVLEEILTHPDIDFLYLLGNHDKNDFLSDLDEDKIPVNLKRFKEDSWTAYTYGNVVISGRELSDDNYKTISVNLILDESKCNIVTLHGQESDYVGRDRTHIVSIPSFKNKHIDYMALGHIHSYKCQKLDERGVYCYSGCLEGRGFDECGDKGFVLIDVDDNDLSITHTFVSFAFRRMYEVNVSVSEDMNMPDVIDAVSSSTQDIPDNSMVRILLNGMTDIDFDVDCDRIVNIFKDKFYFIKVVDHTGTRINYDDFAGDRSLKGEFVRLLRQEDIPEDERAEIIELGIRAILGDEIEV